MEGSTSSMISAAWPPLTALVLAIIYLFSTRNQTGYQQAQSSFNQVVIQRLEQLEKENVELRAHVLRLETENLALRDKVRELKSKLEERGC